MKTGGTPLRGAPPVFNSDRLLRLVGLHIPPLTHPFSPAMRRELSHPPRSPFPYRLSLLFLYLCLLTPLEVLAHPGHSDHEFEAGKTAGTPEAIQVDPVTRDRMGIRVEPVR